MDFHRSGGEQKIAKKMGKAVVDDSANWLVERAFLAVFPHLHALVIPYAVTKSALEHVKWRIMRHQPPNYTFWNRPWTDLRELYEADWHDAVKLLNNRERSSVPQLLLADTSDGPLKLDLVMTDPRRFGLSHEIDELTWKYRTDLIQHLKKNDAYHRSPFSSLAVTGVQREASRVILEVRPADYDDVLRTHYSLDVDWKGRPSLRQTLLRSMPGTLGPLQGSPLPNILGVDVLIFTPSGSLVLQRRSHHVAVRPGEICASSSGGAKPDDVGKRWPRRAAREPRGAGAGFIADYAGFAAVYRADPRLCLARGDRLLFLRGHDGDRRDDPAPGGYRTGSAGALGDYSVPLWSGSGAGIAGRRCSAGPILREGGRAD